MSDSNGQLAKRYLADAGGYGHGSSVRSDRLQKAQVYATLEVASQLEALVGFLRQEAEDAEVRRSVDVHAGWIKQQ